MKIVVSSCLLGHKTRYDGRDKKVEFPNLPPDIEFVPFCPEVEAGLGIPRETIELVRLADGRIRVMGTQTRIDVTEMLEQCCAEMADRLEHEGVDGFVLKARSPSCGIASALHDYDGNVVGAAPGVWARIVQERFPGVPCLDEDHADRLVHR